mgnify:CR=1 FL=1
MPEILEEKVEEFVSNERDKKIKVDWQGLALKRKSVLMDDGLRSWQPLFEKLLDYLIEKEILTYSLKNSWTINRDGFDLSPKKPAPHSQLYFTRKRDAEDYAKAFYKSPYTSTIIKPAKETG